MCCSDVTVLWPRRRRSFCMTMSIDLEAAALKHIPCCTLQLSGLYSLLSAVTSILPNGPTTHTHTYENAHLTQAYFSRIGVYTAC